MAGREAAPGNSGGPIGGGPTAVGELVRQAADLAVRAGGSATGRPVVEALLAHHLGQPVSWLYAHPDALPAEAESRAFGQSLHRLLGGTPLEYLTGRAAFHAIDLAVSPDVLIPRPETETLVDLALERLRGAPRSRIADVGTGSGAIALALAQALPQAQIVATDLSRSALGVAARNVQEHRQEARVTLVQADLLEGVSGPFDLVAANLPYVSDDDLRGVSAAVAIHEPGLALAGGADGLDLVRRLLSQLTGRVRPGGWALLEIGADQGPAARGAARRMMPSATIEVLPDLWGRDRVLALEFER